MKIETVPLIAVLFVLCALCQLLAWRMKLPAILLLLLTGITAGPLMGFVRPEEVLGDLLFPFVSLSVAIILFEGSITLKIRDIRGLHVVVRNMVSIGMVITWLITTLATIIFLDISLEVAILFGAIMVVTGPTVVAPILRTVRPVASVANILKWESIVIDPIGASLAVLVFEFIIAGGGQDALGHTLISFFQLVFLGAAIGCIAGYLFGLCLRHHFIPEFLHNLATLGMVFGTFALANSFQAESGLVTVTVFGIWLANMKHVDLQHILAFKETLSILLISLLFIILAARLDFMGLQQLGWKALLIFLVIQFLARPLNVQISAFGSTLSSSEKHFLAWIAPRGIVAAAISSLFALKLVDYGYSDGALLVPLTFVVILSTVILQSATAYPLARLLRITLPEPDGFLIIGSNRAARLIAGELLNLGRKVVIASPSQERIAEAKKENIPTYYGNPFSAQAGYIVELQGLGTLLALSPYENDNIAAAYHYRKEFGKNNVFILPVTPPKNQAAKQNVLPQQQGKTLFGEKAGFTLLTQLLDEGAEIMHTTLEEKYDRNSFMQNYGSKALPLFSLDTKKQFHLFSPEQPPQPDKDWQLYYLGFSDKENL